MKTSNGKLKCSCCCADYKFNIVRVGRKKKINICKECVSTLVSIFALIDKQERNNEPVKLRRVA